MLDKLIEVSTKYSCSIGTLVIAWTMEQTSTMNVLCGARKPEHLQENAQAASVHLKGEDITFIDNLSKSVTVG